LVCRAQPEKRRPSYATVRSTPKRCSTVRACFGAGGSDVPDVSDALAASMSRSATTGGTSNLAGAPADTRTGEAADGRARATTLAGAPAALTRGAAIVWELSRCSRTACVDRCGQCSLRLAAIGAGRIGR